MRLVMMGTGVFAEPTFSALFECGHEVVGLFTQPDRATGTARGSTRQTGIGMKELARQRGIPCHQPESINTPEGLAMLADLAPDLLVVAAYGQILSKGAIASPKLGAINVHASLLPKYRGASPIAHAILSGETRTGVTIIRIVPGLDAGEMLAKVEVDILPDETTGELEARLAPLGAAICVDVIARIGAGPVSGETQDPALVTKAPKVKKEHGIIDWSKTATAITLQIRAWQPWPTSYTWLLRDGQDPVRVIVSKAEAVEGTGASEPGLILPMAGELRIAAGGGSALRVLELQPSGKKKMPTKEFLRGRPVQAGDRFGTVSE